MNATQNDVLRQFVKLLEENGRPAQAQEMTFLLLYMNNMSQQLDAVIAELQEIKAQLAHAQESPAKETVKDMTDASEKEAHETRNAFKEFRTKVKDCASRAVNGFKTFGVSALDAAVSAMHIKPALEAIQRRLDRMIEKNEKNIAKVESVGHELRSAGSHVKNAGRAAIGRETRAVDGGQEGHIQGAILAPLRVRGKLLSGMNRATLSAIKGVEHLKLSAEIRTGKKPSIRQALLENKAEILGLPAPEPAREQSASEPEGPQDGQTQERPEETQPEEAQPEQPQTVPLYRQTRKYALAHGELDAFQASIQENIACKKAIEASIEDGYDGMSLKPDIKGVLEKFGAERVSYILAATVQAKSWDQRFSQDNQAWAKTVPGTAPPDSSTFFVVDSHSGLVNSFIRMARKEMASVREQPEKKPSIRAQLDDAKPARQEQERPKETWLDQSQVVPFYRQTGEYAMAHGELDAFRASIRENIACKNMIEAYIEGGHDGMKLKPDIKGILEKFGGERVSYVLAATVQAKSWDQQFSQENQAWAETVPMAERPDCRNLFIVESRPAELDGFTKMARKEMAAAREQPEKKSSIRAQLDAAKSAQKEQPAVQRQKEHKAPEAAL